MPRIGKKQGRVFCSLRMFFIAILLLLLIPQNAQADYFVFEDAKSGITLSYPDTWKQQNNKNPADTLTIAAPSGNDRAQCVVKNHPDHRYTIYPAEYGSAIQKSAVSLTFWKSYMRHYDDYTLNNVYDGGGLGRWHVSYAFASYTTHNGTALETRRAIMFASLYHDTVFIVECSALNAAYNTWENNFKSIIKSIDFKKNYHENSQGDYAQFIKDLDLYFGTQTNGAGTVEY